ncbi:MAG: aminopeptidase [Gammaproteobacteria bacterium]|nr:aminopeptidase [Gammaproteobacteria bacterium]MCP5424210.1 aminopeptidase [Gammaproteobacteria bacterium]MCP5458913.1 aminopeptidase [Gammaproteobacteria bacterium]
MLTGCTDLAYYGQAIGGQWRILQSRRPVSDLLHDPATDPKLTSRLTTADALRDFASQELGLPDNGSYRNYVDLHRPYVVRSVFAAPALSLQPRQWCFPLVGCVSYRGYFDATAALHLADTLRAQGDDVYVANVPAFSTLGWFDDPLLNTFVYWPNGRLAELIFHELAHQRLFVPGDTVFNESYATAVGRLGTRLWLGRYGTATDLAEYDSYQAHQSEFLKLALRTRDELARLYASNKDDTEKLAGKARLFSDLQDRYRQLKSSWNGYAGYDNWFAQDLNNAKLAALGAYTDFVPAFEILFEQTGRNVVAFHTAVEELAALPPEARSARLQTLMTP